MSGLVVDELTLLGSRCGPIGPALRLLERGLVDPTALISSVFLLSEGREAFEYAAKPGILKVLLRFDQPERSLLVKTIASRERLDSGEG
jgi:threonine dehydrogenase-like Zn-dependent dehydrogenase